MEIPVSDPETVKVKMELLQHHQVLELASEVEDWISIAPTRNNDPKISYFKLRMLADFGAMHGDLDLSITIEKATAHVIDDMFAIRCCHYRLAKSLDGQHRLVLSFLFC